MKKIISAFLIIIIVYVIFFLTFQEPEETINLSEWLRSYILKVGIDINPHNLRSLIHVPMYFLLGFSLCLFFKNKKSDYIIVLLCGIIIGLMDEITKIYLPTREFELRDLILDNLGVLLSIVVIKYIRFIKNKYK